MSGKIIILVYNGDSAGANRKSMLLLAKDVGVHVWCFANRCLIHQLFRSVSVVLEKVALTRPVKCLTNVFGISHRMDQFRRVVQQDVKDNRRYHSGLTLPPDENSAQRQHSRYLIDKLLAEVGSDKSRILQTVIWLADMGDFAEMNGVWDAWVAKGSAPARACGEAKLARADFTVEIIVTAAA